MSENRNNVDNLPNHGMTGLSISQEEVDLFLDYIVDAEPEPSQVHQGNDNVKNKSIRDADLYFIDPKEEKLYKILNKIAVSANRYFKYDINGIERAQIVRYTAPSKGYEYHVDIGPEGTAALRKISMSLLLNDDFEGGEICFRTSESEQCTSPKTGEVVMFTSFLPHKIKPVTKGERFAVVAWFSGPPFR